MADTLYHALIHVQQPPSAFRTLLGHYITQMASQETRIDQHGLFALVILRPCRLAMQGPMLYNIVDWQMSLVCHQSWVVNRHTLSLSSIVSTG